MHHASALPLPRRGPVAAFLELTKLRISGASTFTAAAGYVCFRRGADLGLLAALLGILLLAMGASALNEYQERHLDARMPRTWHRPLPRGEVAPGTALALALALGAAGFATLLVFNNLAAAALGALAMVWYNGFYTPLKRVWAFAVVPGSLIGALPPAIGWAAAGGSVKDPTILALAFVFFIWQVPHFWLLVALHAEGYEEAGFPTLAGLFGRRRLARLTWTWICGTSASLALVPLFRVVGAPAGSLVLALAGVWMPIAARPLLGRDLGPRVFRRVFMDINLFALVLTAAVILDPLWRR